METTAQVMARIESGNLLKYETMKMHSLAQDARVAELEAALHKIHDGNTMNGNAGFTHGDVIQAHYAICRSVQC